MKYQHVFASYPCFNAIQSKVLDDVLYSGMSVTTYSNILVNIF